MTERKNMRGKNERCSYGNCPNIRLKDPTLRFIPFPKPCGIFFDEMVKGATLRNYVPIANGHKVEDCEKCSKCLSWIKLCQRANGKLRELKDVSKRSYVCGKHFFCDTGPTAEHPNPLPAGLTPFAMKTVSSVGQTSEDVDVKPNKDELDKALGISPQSMPNVSFTLCHDHLKILSPQSSEGADKDPKNHPDPINTCPNSKDGESSQDTREVSWQDIAEFTISCMQTGWACEIRDNAFNFISVGQWRNDSDECSETIVNIKVVVTVPLKCNVFLLGQQLAETERIGLLASRVCSMETLNSFLVMLKSVALCCGIWEKKYVNAFHEIGHMMRGEICMQTQAVRAAACKLTTNGVRCHECVRFLGALRCKMGNRRLFGSNSASKFCNNRFLTREDLRRKAFAGKKALKKLEDRNRFLRRKLQDLMKSGKVCKHKKDMLTSILDECGSEDEGNDVLKFRRLFLKEQLKVVPRMSTKNFKWHPEVIKWCIYMKRLSASTYEALRESKCVILPSQQTLNNYLQNFENISL